MKINAAKITRIALSTAFIAVGAQLAIPTIPAVTLQTLCIFITAVMLKPLEAGIASLIYLLLGMVGAPVFSSFSGGIGVLLSVSGGFLISFPFVAMAVSKMTHCFKGAAFTYAFSFTAGTIISYLLGALWIHYMGYYDGSLGSMLTTFVLSFIPFDAIKIALATVCAIKLDRTFKNDTKKPENNKPQNN